MRFRGHLVKTNNASRDGGGGRHGSKTVARHCCTRSQTYHAHPAPPSRRKSKYSSTPRDLSDSEVTNAIFVHSSPLVIDARVYTSIRRMRRRRIPYTRVTYLCGRIKEARGDRATLTANEISPGEKENRRRKQRRHRPRVGRILCATRTDLPGDHLTWSECD